MNVLVACEESQRTATAFREMGINAYSADILECSGGHPEYHIKGDVLKILNGGIFYTMNGDYNYLPEWDLIIAHPPCTYLTNAATQCHSIKTTPLDKINKRTLKRVEAISFFMKIAMSKCNYIAIENPVGIMSTVYRQPDQIIHPYQFASEITAEDYVTKRTCLWLKNLPPLKINDLPHPDKATFGRRPNGKKITWTESISVDRQRERSKTFQGIANAFASQWGKYVREVEGI